MASLAGQEDFALGGSDVLDRRADGYLPNEAEHFAQDSILPMKLYCNNKECKKYKSTSLGSCFLVQELNKDKKYLYFATAAHNLYCPSCKNYRWVKPILKWAAGQREAGSFLLGAEDRGVSGKGFYGWMKVSDGYIRGISDKKSSKECYPFDYGILAVNIASIAPANAATKKFASKIRKLGMFAAPPERHDFVELAYLCGYPGEVWTTNRNVPPQGAPANEDDLQYMGGERVAGHRGYFKWKVQGGRFWMPPNQSKGGQNATGKEKASERRSAERRTAALYPMPQSHGGKICEKQDSDWSKTRLFRHYIDSSAGQSGAPVYLVKPEDDDGDEQYVALGIHVGLWEDERDEAKRMGFNVAVRLHGDVLSEMKSWVSDANNRATDQSKPDVDTRKDTEDFEMELPPPKFFGSDMGGSEAAAQAPPSQERHINPWRSTEYKANYELLLRRMNPRQVLAHLEVLQLIGYYEKEEIEDKHPRSVQNTAILTRLSAVSRHFGKFREMLRRYPDCQEIAAEMDLVGPDPETDPDSKEARERLIARDK